MTGRALRGIAIVIALLGVVDPVLTIVERVPPVVAMSVAGGAAAAGQRVKEVLGGRYVVVDAPVAGARATVAVGDVAADAGSPAVVVIDDTPRAVISRLDVPGRALAGEQVPVEITVRPVGGAALRGVGVELWVGDTMAERRTIDLPGDAPHDVRLSFVPAGPGPHHIRAMARSGDHRSAADALVTVVDRRWRVLVHDARPAWPSTFVRRAIEADARFDVSARVATARRADVASGRPPAALDTPATLDPFDVIVVGVPGVLDAHETAALERFMRVRGGTVVLLLDETPDSPVAGVRWTERLSENPLAIVDEVGEAVLEASEVAVPRDLPLGAEPIATAGGIGTLVWQYPVGDGRLIASGALDAWRYRASERSRFDAFWRSTIADAASRAPEAVEVAVHPRVVRPRDTVRVQVAIRGPESGEVSVRGVLEHGGGREPIRLWPVAPGRFDARLKAPATGGHHRVVVTTAGGETAADLVVSPDAATIAADPERLETWTSAHGGRVVPLSTIADPRDGLAATLDAVVTPGTRPVLWRPMRSAWWIVPFALALGADWWLRRRARHLTLDLSSL